MPEVSSGSLTVAMATPEVTPLAKTGGLGDVLGSLPLALDALGVRVFVVMPAYRQALDRLAVRAEACGTLEVPVADRREPATVLRTTIQNGIPVFLIKADKYFDRPYLYFTPEGDYPDNAERFTFFSRAVLEVLREQHANILHCHDWQSALAIAFLKAQAGSYERLAGMKTVMTVHNLGYQGLFGHHDWHILGLEDWLFSSKFLEFYGQINFLKAGLVFADAITTVSPSYAREIQLPEQGFGLDGVLRERRECLYGILNGVDYGIWDPAGDKLIAETYSPADPAGKRKCKEDLQGILGLDSDPETPLLGMVSRLAVEKGFDLLEAAWESLLSRGCQLAILATGGNSLQERFSALAAGYPGKAGIRLAFDESLAHRIMAGSDMLLMPSRYEPGGLTQLYAMKYGTIPIVRATGGLRDTVQDFDPQSGSGTGFTFGPYSADALLEAIDRALGVFSGGPWQTIVANAMSACFSWERSSKSYLDLYCKLVSGK